MLHFPLCLEYLIGMPKIDIVFGFDIVVCVCIRLVPYDVFSTQIYFQNIAHERPINAVFVRPSFRKQFLNVGQ